MVHIIPSDPTVDSIFQIDAALGADFMNLIGELHIYPAEKNYISCPPDRTATDRT
ncbi:MAG: hypothetical protein V8S95_01415 [Odoribacter sp.]